MGKTFSNFLKDESGAAAAEYALLLAIVGAGIVAGMGALGSSIKNKLTNTGKAIDKEVTIPAN